MPLQSRKLRGWRRNWTESDASSLASKRLQKGSDVSPRELLHRYLDQCPLIAIIRGVTPEDAEAIGAAIADAGMRIIEVPLNSPEPPRSVEMLAKRFGDEVLVGAGTVLDPADVARVHDAGGRIIVSPDTNVDVI